MTLAAFYSKMPMQSLFQYPCPRSDTTALVLGQFKSGLKVYLATWWHHASSKCYWRTGDGEACSTVKSAQRLRKICVWPRPYSGAGAWNRTFIACVTPTPLTSWMIPITTRGVLQQLFKMVIHWNCDNITKTHLSIRYATQPPWSMPAPLSISNTFHAQHMFEFKST